MKRNDRGIQDLRSEPGMSRLTVPQPARILHHTYQDSYSQIHLQGIQEPYSEPDIDPYSGAYTEMRVPSGGSVRLDSLSGDPTSTRLPKANSSAIISSYVGQPGPVVRLDPENLSDAGSIAIDGAGSAQLRNEGFEPFFLYDNAIEDSEIQAVQDLGISRGWTQLADDNDGANTDPSLLYQSSDYLSSSPHRYNQFSAQLDPPFNPDLPSSPPNSPPRRAAPRAMLQQQQSPGAMNTFQVGHALGISGSGFLPPLNVSIIPGTPDTATLASGSSASDQALGNQSPMFYFSPAVAPPLPVAPVSPYGLQLEPQPQYRLAESTAPMLLDPNNVPTLSPESPSPYAAGANGGGQVVSSPDGFQWQPIVTVQRSAETERILEAQRHSKHKQKRRSCLPDGVVDEYVGSVTPEGSFRCLYPNCGRMFNRSYNLRSHIQTHLSDRPYVCDVCDARFVRPHDLRRHARCHSEQRPFVCPCGKGFSRQDALQRHRLREICAGGISQGRSPPKHGPPPSFSDEGGDYDDVPQTSP